MRTLTTALALLAISLPVTAADVPPRDQQIAAALQAAPEDRRAGARVLGYDSDGKLVTLREGSNDMVCLSDNPAVETFEVACYHESLDPFMARGRELSAQGLTGRARAEQRLKEADDGKLELPEAPSMLYVTTGSGFDAASGEITDAYTRWVIYVPYAKADELGMPARPAGMAPWLMGEGTAGAHIMITPPRPKND